jgi:hypothetical protein
MKKKKDSVLEHHFIPQTNDRVLDSDKTRGTKWCGPEAALNESVSRRLTAVSPKQRAVSPKQRAATSGTKTGKIAVVFFALPYLD